jgi:hypothetical protein
LVPDTLHEFEILERSGLKIGVIGLVEKYVYTYLCLPLFSCAIHAYFEYIG